MDMLFRLTPSNFWELFRIGVYDVPVLMVYLTPLIGAAVGLFVRGLRRRRAALAGVLGGVVALIIALARLNTGLPPQYMDFSDGAIATPTESGYERISEFEEPITMQLSAPQGGLDPLLSAALTNLQRPNRLSYQIDIHTADDGQLPNQLYVRRGQAVTAIPYERLLLTNPAAREGEPWKLLNLENELLQAEALLRSSAPRIYRVAGAEDAMYPTVLVSTLRDLTIEAITPLNLSQAVPEDCTFVLMDDPRADLTEQQSGVLQSYLRRGGRLLLITDYAYGAMPNLNTALEEYGLSAIDGVVFDPGAAMGGWAEYSMPALTDQHIIGRWLQAARRMPLMPLSHAIELRTLPGVESSAILTTTGSAYIQLSSLEHESLERSDDDPAGPFVLAAAAEMGSGRVLWIASADMMTIASDTDVGGANSALLLASMRWLMDAQVEPVEARVVG